MSRYIDADKLIEAIEDSIGCINFSSPYQDDNDAIVEGMERIKSIVDEAPTVDAVPVVHGQWKVSDSCKHKPYRIKNPEKWVIYMCSKCGYSNGRRKSNYCPHCGAKMDGKDESAKCGTTGFECIRCNPGACDHRKEE